MNLQARMGEALQSPAVHLGTEDISSFVAGIAETNERHTDPEHTDACAPRLIVAKSIIPGTGAMLMGLNLGAKLMRIVHGSIEIQFGRLLHQGDALSCNATFMGVEEKRTGDVLSFSFDIADHSAVSVCSGITRYFLRGDRTGDGSKAVPAEEPGPADIEVVDLIPDGQSLLYAEGSGDRFPIHTDENFAKGVGLPGVILHGMCTLAFATRAVIEAVGGGDPSRLQAVSVRFTGMVFHGDRLTHHLWRTPEGVRFKSVNQDGRTVLDDGRAMIVSNSHG